MKLQAALQSLADSPTAVLDKRRPGTLRLPMTHSVLKDMKEKKTSRLAELQWGFVTLRWEEVLVLVRDVKGH